MYNMEKLVVDAESILIGNAVTVNGRDYEIVGVSGGDIHSDECLITKFDVFDTTPYTYLALHRDRVAGNRILASYVTDGIFDMDSGLVRNQNSENVERGSVLDIRPTEPFLEGVPSNREHYTVTLIETDLSDFGGSS